ncbi:MAG TPA: universal stress protein [Gemmatimonadaceae bacterium]|nr:universal stress protein [Gemmatimonadaceae bacterium]
MYTRILVPLEHSPYDTAILDHVRHLARHTGASLVLMHVADGFAARNVSPLKLRESEEIREDREYIERLCADLEREGFKADCVLAGGDPAREICEAAQREECDLIAMSTHGHRFLKDLLYGSVAESVRHRSFVPVLLVRGMADGSVNPTPMRGVPAVPPPA